MVKWRKLKIGDRLIMKDKEFGQIYKVPCSVIEIYEDHAILWADLGYNMWIDDNFEDLFYRSR